MAKEEHIGILGGTFDPPHNTHLEIARAALRLAPLDRVLFVVAAEPPHKRGEVYATANDRLDMVHAALRDEAAMEASGVELERAGPSYTADTLDILHQRHPQARLHFILGFDALADFPGWREPGRILARARILAVRRPGAQGDIPPMLANHADTIPFDESELSSTDIRARLATGEPVTGLLPPAVELLIRERGLYGVRP